ncbi:hypothetical protein SAMD00019534_109120 [Acytostelium subglobosum LB1]|uniref:hypothetical protein n=1 Tax=Acytostelium subglobosum LB1 TaxID=1410327 RepID=UPI0006447CAC|nr:hypothetical protein SAMD00019534_109120 [Acytostelium subglobosum LB1]GAM27736.1 hypothetical protein SAMD00019534_109120 [Acytostelium subglobosum LB1]|eukprot:XP_012749395.1 hypothetical protein SAMD00019534_109120 [Acytostelium subglobosum LB1]
MSDNNNNDNNNNTSVDQPKILEEEVSLGEAVASMQEQANSQIETKVLNWMKEMLAKEMKRIKDQGAKCTPFEVKNTGLVKEKNIVINRLEIKTIFDFDTVLQILISDPVECPHKPGYYYINVLLFTRKPVPYIIPYIYRKSDDNKLTDWLFINDHLKRSQHKVNQFESV